MRVLALAAILGAAPALAQVTTPAPAPAPSWVAKGVAQLSLLDKISAHSSTVDVKVGGTTSFGTLSIQVQSCVGRPPDMPADSAAFLQIGDSRSASSAFRGWLLANTPAVSLFQDPIYDVRLLGCR